MWGTRNAQCLSCDGAEVTFKSDLFIKLSKEGDKLNTGAKGWIKEWVAEQKDRQMKDLLLNEGSTGPATHTAGPVCGRTINTGRSEEMTKV